MREKTPELLLVGKSVRRGVLDMMARAIISAMTAKGACASIRNLNREARNELYRSARNGDGDGWFYWGRGGDWDLFSNDYEGFIITQHRGRQKPGIRGSEVQLQAVIEHRMGNES
jgi:hypothetical protein